MNRYTFSQSILILLFSVTTLLAQGEKFTPHDLLKIKYVVETSISPDANYVVYTLHVPRPLTDEPGNDYRHLYIVDLTNNSSKELIGDNNNIYSPGWLDENTITFRAKLNDDKKTQVYSINLGSGETTRITDAMNSVLQYEVDHEGKKLAYISESEEPEEKTKFNDLGFDAEIYEEEINHRSLYILDLETGKVKNIISNKSVYDFSWHPDGEKLAAVIAEKNLVDYSYMFKDIYKLDIKTGETELLLDVAGKLGDVKWSPDGKHLALVAASSINDAVTSSLFIIEENNKKSFDELKNYVKDFEGSVNNINWKDDKTLLYSSQESVYRTLREIAIGEDERSLLIEKGEIEFSGFDYADGIVSTDASTIMHSWEVYTYSLEEDALERRTDHNTWLSDKQFAKQEAITYEARDGLKIEGVLFYPLDFEEDKKYPLIVHIHGGPESSTPLGWQTGYNRWGQFAAAQGFFVFMPNYRASSGRGVEFTMMGLGDLAGAEFTDVIDGIDHLIEKGYVDKERVGIGGGSYGGYFSAWAATKYTDRFAAAVVFVGIGNQVSKRNTTDIPYEDYYVHWGFWTHENEDLVWERSPVRYAHLSKTPTLILHGKKDPRVHPSQSLELYRALKIHSKAPVRLVWYPGQGHGNRKNTSRLDYALRTLNWFKYYLMSENPKDEMPEKYFEIPPAPPKAGIDEM